MAAWEGMLAVWARCGMGITKARSVGTIIDCPDCIIHAHYLFLVGECATPFPAALVLGAPDAAILVAKQCTAPIMLEHYRLKEASYKHHSGK